MKKVNSLVAESLKYNILERINIVGNICDSIAEQSSSINITEEQKLELDNRLKYLENNPNTGSSWEVVKKRLIK